MSQDMIQTMSQTYSAFHGSHVLVEVDFMLIFGIVRGIQEISLGVPQNLLIEWLPESKLVQGGHHSYHGIVCSGGKEQHIIYDQGILYKSPNWDIMLDIGSLGVKICF